MVYQRKKRSQEQNHQLSVPQVQTSLFASSDLENIEAENSFSEDGANAFPSLETQQQQASQPSYDFGNIPLFAKENPVQRSPQLPLIQAQLTVGPVGDKYEQEADRVAAHVVDQINSPKVQQPVQRQTNPQTGAEHPIHQQPLVNLQKTSSPQEDVQMKPTLPQVGQAGGSISQGLESQIQGEKGNGQALDSSLQQRMGQAMGADFSGVKIHTDAQSDQLNRSISSESFYHRSGCLFSAGKLRPR